MDRIIYIVNRILLKVYLIKLDWSIKKLEADIRKDIRCTLDKNLKLIEKKSINKKHKK